MSSLLATWGPHCGHLFPLSSEFSLGRAASCTLQLVDLQVSRLHAVIRRREGAYVLEDQVSRNGTQINGLPVKGQQVLQPLDELQVGGSRFLFAPLERSLRVRYQPMWVTLGGEAVERGLQPISPLETPCPPSEEALSALLDCCDRTQEEEGLSRGVLDFFAEHFHAPLGVLFQARPGGGLVPLQVVGAEKGLSLNRRLVEQGLSAGGTYHGPVSVSRFPNGRRALEQHELTVLGVPWFQAGVVAGLLWLEWPGRLEGVDGVAREVQRLLHRVGPALEAARGARLLRRRQRAEGAKQEGARIPVRLILGLSGQLERAEALAQGGRSLNVVGPRGCGKRRTARFLHGASLRGEGPLVTLSCGTLSEAQLNLQLLGAQRGSLPGLERALPGVLELADGGTLVLEHVEELSAGLQEELLRALSLGEVVRRGGGAPVPFEVRVLSISRRPLEQAVSDGQLRAELLPYVGEERLEVPGLDRLKGHVSALALEVVRRGNVLLSRQLRGFSASAEAYLAGREFTLNVVELEGLVLKAMELAEGELVTREELELASELPARGGREARGWAARDATFRDVERRLVTQALRLSGGRRPGAAELLGVSREALERLILDYQIDPDRLG